MVIRVRHGQCECGEDLQTGGELQDGCAIGVLGLSAKLSQLSEEVESDGENLRR